MDSLNLLQLVILYHLGFVSVTMSSFCETGGKREEEIIPVCHKKNITGDRVFIDSSGAKDKYSDMCRCSVRSTQQNKPVLVTFSSVVDGGSGLQFRISNSVFNSTTKKQDILVYNYSPMTIEFKKEKSVSGSICLGLLVAEFGEITVTCHSADIHVPINTTSASALTSGGLVIYQPTTETQMDADKEGNSTLNFNLVIGGLGALVAVLAGAIVILIYTRYTNSLDKLDTFEGLSLMGIG